LALVAASVAVSPAGSLTQAPDVEMRDGAGRIVRLADFRGVVVLVDLWASWCAPCKVSVPQLDALQREYRARGVQVVAVNLDERRRDADRFLKGIGPDLLVVFDPKARVFEAFGAAGVPSSYLVDRQGRIRHVHRGFTAETIATYRAQLDALLAERPE
jgi:thiol-disulfide isomerase/thioredoxin